MGRYLKCRVGGGFLYHKVNENTLNLMLYIISKYIKLNVIHNFKISREINVFHHYQSLETKHLVSFQPIHYNCQELLLLSVTITTSWT